MLIEGEGPANITFDLPKGYKLKLSTPGMEPIKDYYDERQYAKYCQNNFCGIKLVQN